MKLGDFWLHLQFTVLVLIRMAFKQVPLCKTNTSQVVFSITPSLLTTMHPSTPCMHVPDAVPVPRTFDCPLHHVYTDLPCGLQRGLYIRLRQAEQRSCIVLTIQPSCRHVTASSPLRQARPSSNPLQWWRDSQVHSGAEVVLWQAKGCCRIQ